ncbi:MAG TPA: SPW repeat protein [Candidatus Saccharimonadales bacterium]|nr:SPW repeat protein [Candidatus Saccharimonadales bacterium]
MKFLSPRTHTIIGFVVGIALLLAPNIFGFSDVGGAAVAVPRIIGVIVLLSELTVKGSFSGMGFVPMKLHLPMDMAMGAFLAVSPWLFGFADQEANAWVPHLVVGIMMIGYALVTRPAQDDSRSTATV